MSTKEEHLPDVKALHEAGRYEEALVLLGQRFAEAESEAAPNRNRYFMTLFEWRMLLEDYPPAQAPLRALRDAQIERLLAGAEYGGAAPGGGDDDYDYRRTSRFFLISEMNDMLRDERSTYDTFIQLDALHPVQADRYAHIALPAAIAMQDFALADRYRIDPLASLDEVNEAALGMPLLVPYPEAPRLASDLIRLAWNTRIGMAVMRGRGDDTAADALRSAVLAGLESDEIRAIVQRELDHEGSIMRDVLAHQESDRNRQQTL